MLPLAQHYHLADQIALLDEGQVKSIGSWQDFQGQLTEIRKFTFDGDDTEKAHTVQADPFKSKQRPSETAMRSKTCIERRAIFHYTVCSRGLSLGYNAQLVKDITSNLLVFGVPCL